MARTKRGIGQEEVRPRKKSPAGWSGARRRPLSRESRPRHFGWEGPNFESIARARVFPGTETRTSRSSDAPLDSVARPLARPPLPQSRSARARTDKCGAFRSTILSNSSLPGGSDIASERRDDVRSAGHGIDLGRTQEEEKVQAGNESSAGDSKVPENHGSPPAQASLCSPCQGNR